MLPKLLFDLIVSSADPSPGQNAPNIIERQTQE